MRAKRSTKYYQENPEARKKKAKYDKAYHSTPARRKYRAELNQKNREAGTYGNGDGLDYDHGVRRMIKASTNRAKKMQEGGKLPEFKPFKNEMDKRLFFSQQRANEAAAWERDNFFNRPKASGALEPSYIDFDLLSGRYFYRQGVKQGFNLMKSAPTFMQKHGKKLFSALSAAETINDFNEMNE